MTVSKRSEKHLPAKTTAHHKKMPDQEKLQMNNSWKLTQNKLNLPIPTKVGLVCSKKKWNSDFIP
jgi:hypothetical protein